AFCESFIDAMQTSYPSVLNNDDFTAIITEQQKARLQSYLDDAEQKGAKLITINPSNESFEGSKKLPMTIVLGATDDMLVMSEEIFGPILPVLPFDKLDDAFDFVNSRPRPLALYYFDWDKKRADTLLKATHSGGVCINDTLSHVMADDVPFGGVGPSGMGHYHGEEGFLTFSKAKAVVRKGRINATALVGPPWGNRMFSMMKVMQNLRFRKRKIRDL
ncbi:MAG: aldehyde dehydrogenase family protein, partial [Pseudomonadota bacterium]